MSVIDLSASSGPVPAEPGEQAVPAEPTEQAALAEPGEQAVPAEPTEQAALAAIEADLAAVEEAMSGLDRIDSSEIGGAAAAAQVAAIVASERFDVTP